MAAAPKLMTLDDYLATPESVAPTELAFGIMRVKEAPAPRHQSAVADLFRALDWHVRERQVGRMWLAPLDVVLDDRKALVVQPDLLFISTARQAIVRDRVRGAPDLMIEVLSPSARVGTTLERLNWYAAYGVRECWLVHLDRRQVSVTGFADGERQPEHVFQRSDPIVSAVLPEFRLSFDDMLSEPS